MIFLCAEDVGTGVPNALRLVGADVRALVQLGWGGRPDVEWLAWAGRRMLVFNCNKKMLLVAEERTTIINEKVGIIFITNREEYLAKVPLLLLKKWDNLELLDETEPRPFAKFLSPNGRFSDSYRHFRL